MKRLILAGGGHAHLIVLEQLARHRPPALDIILVTPSPWQYYSGMLPGWMTGDYAEDDCRVDLHPLCARAGVQLVIQAVTAILPNEKCVELADGNRLSYDLLSLDTGSEVESTQLEPLGDRLQTAKPLDRFGHAWHALLDEARDGRRLSLAIAGGGAAGVELALAAKTALATSSAAQHEIWLVTGRSGLLPGHGGWVRRRAKDALRKAGITLIAARASATAETLVMPDGQTLAMDRVIAATGARAPRWLAASGLSLSTDGFVAVDPFHRSLSHPDIFAAGDVAAREDATMARSGVHAVHAGPILAHNLVAAAQGRSLRPYRPRKRSLYLLASGRRTAIASWGGLSVGGRWVWRWKDRIDRRFIARFKAPVS